MTAVAIPSSPLEIPERWQRALWLAVAVFAGAAAALGAAPFLILTAILFAGALVGVLHSPLAFLAIMTVMSGVGIGWTDAAAIQLAGRNINVNGLRWAIVLAADVAILLRLRSASLPRELRAWWWFVLLAGAGMLWAPDRFEGLKQWLLYAAPLLTAAVMMQVLRTERDIIALRTAFYAAAIIGTIVMVGPSLLGRPLDPEGRLLHRAFGTFLLPVIALALARRQLVWIGVLFALVIGTLSRITLVAGLGLGLGLGLVTTGKGMGWGRRLALVGGMAGLAWLALSYGPLRERIFTDPRRGFTPSIEVTTYGGRAQLDVGGVQLSGRGIVWLLVGKHALERPVAGHGTGSSTDFLKRNAPSDAGIFPHNELLRLFHDLGGLGLGLGLGLVGVPVIAYRRIYRRASSALARELALAAMLSWMALGITALFDNVLGYFVFFTYNVFLLSVLAVRAAALEREA